MAELLAQHPHAACFDLGNHTVAAVPQHSNAPLTLDRPLQLCNARIELAPGAGCLVTSAGVACTGVAFVVRDVPASSTPAASSSSSSMQGVVTVAGTGASLSLLDCQLLNYSMHARVSQDHGRQPAHPELMGACSRYWGQAIARSSSAGKSHAFSVEGFPCMQPPPAMPPP